ncbi:MAG: hypothetical protein HOY75_02075, partial [Streptomyces sp.]|nr:hypothetical protein [Streptomyces sp.]
MIQRLCALLEDAGAELSEVELRDVLWFAATTAPSATDGDGDGDGAEQASTAGADGPASDGASDSGEERKGAQRHLAAQRTAGEPEPDPLAP